MNIILLKSKIHRAAVTGTERDYIGSITIDAGLMAAAGIVPYEQVQVADIDNGERLITYAIPGEPGSGTICLNGAAADKALPGHRVIIMAYGSFTADEAGGFAPSVVFVDGDNRITRIQNEERHGSYGI